MASMSRVIQILKDKFPADMAQDMRDRLVDDFILYGGCGYIKENNNYFVVDPLKPIPVIKDGQEMIQVAL
jgi:hypothetical protein